jgi:phage shock protein PspC (stress-responsive transcriptional regulator)
MSKVLDKYLYKSTENRIFTGVAAGIADYINTSHSLIRILFILTTLAGGLGLVLYITLSILLPTEEEIIEQEDQSFYYKVTHGEVNYNQITSKSYSDIIDKLASTQNIFALVIIFIGVFTLQFNIVPWMIIPDSWRYPSIILTIGLGFIVKSVANNRK